MSGATMLSTSAYAAVHGKSVRMVQRYVTEGRIPSELIGDVVHVPADAPWPRKRAGEIVTTSPTSSVVAPAPMPVVSPLGALGTLEEAAELLGTDRAGIRRMGRDGLLVVGPYGPHRSLRVYVPAR